MNGARPVLDDHIEADRRQADYVFDTPYMDYVCGIVGNALPCDFAEALACQVAAEIARRDARS